MNIKFEDQVAIVTGAGAGLGRSHALALAERGARVIVNDLGDASGYSEAADAVVKEIESAGGIAIAHGANVAQADDVDDMVSVAMQKWGRIDVLINNAGILRDKTFAKMSEEDFDIVVRVHLLGSAICAKAVWGIMREQNYGRIVLTTSSSGMYGNFGQSNYGAAKCGVVGLMNTLSIEGQKYDIHVNAVSPVASTQMTEGLLPEETLALFTPESVTAGVLTLCDNEAPNRVILCAGAGGYASTKIYETEGIYLPPEMQTPEHVRAHIDEILDPSHQRELAQGPEQSIKFLNKAARHLGVKLG